MNSFKQTLLIISALALGSVLTGCSGGGGNSGNSSTGGVYFTHSELADEFVYRLNVDVGYDVQLVKVNTLQNDFIVVYDHDTETYDAYDLSYYNPGENMYDFIVYNQDDFFYDLDYLGGNLYEDYWTGTLFQESEITSKDLLKMAALKEELQVEKTAAFLTLEYGFSEKRGFDVARLTTRLQKAPKNSMTDADYDNFSQEILGASISQFQTAVKSFTEGNTNDLASLVEIAAEKNGTTPEQLNKVIDTMFSVYSN